MSGDRIVKSVSLAQEGGAGLRGPWRRCAPRRPPPAVRTPPVGRPLARREHGPVFLADRKPHPRRRHRRLYPITGRAAEIFEEATRPLADPADQTEGWTLHQLRHAMHTHEAENGTNTAALLARSRHACVRSLGTVRTGPTTEGQQSRSPLPPWGS